MTTTDESDNDQLNQSFSVSGATVTPTFSGSGDNIETSTYVENANGATTDDISGTGSFGAPAYAQTVTVATNADSSIATTTDNYDATDALINKLVAQTSPDGLIKSYAFDTTGEEGTSNLDAAAADIIDGAGLPGSMLGTDVIESDATTLNADGSKTEVVESAYGNSFSNQRSLTTIDTSANGLVTTTFIDNDGSGIYQEVETSTVNPDGSQTQVFNYYNDSTGAPQQIDSMTVGSTLLGTNTYTVSANGLVDTLTSSAGVADTTTNFANGNGSYEWSSDVQSGSQAAKEGETNGSASHFIDANGIVTWSWNNGAGSSGTIAIDVTTEQQDVAIANEIYQTILGHPMDEAETQYLAQYISNGILNREELAYQLFNSNEYVDNIAITPLHSNQLEFIGWNIFAVLEDALGRLPTSEELGEFTQSYTYAEYSTYTAGIEAIVPAAVAVAQYAMDQGVQTNLTTIDPNSSLVSPTPAWINPANLANVGSAGTYSYSGYLVFTYPSSGSVTIDGNGNVIEAESGALNFSGYGNAIDVAGEPVTIAGSNGSILIDDGSEATVSGNDNQISQSGPSEFTLTSGTGDVVYVTSAPALPVSDESPDTNSFSTTNASNASITIASGAGAASAPEIINGNSDSVSVGPDAFVTVNGAGDSVSANLSDGGEVTVVDPGATAMTVTNWDAGGVVDLANVSVASAAIFGTTLDVTEINGQVLTFQLSNPGLISVSVQSDGDGGSNLVAVSSIPAYMYMQDSNTGQFEVYDISNSAITGAASVGQVGLEWQVVGFGEFSGNANEFGDMLIRNSNSGAFELYDVSNNQITAAVDLGEVGLEWSVIGFADFSGNAGEHDMLMRNSNSGALEYYDISDSTITAAGSMGQIGLEWQVAGFGDFSGNAGESGDMLMRDSNGGTFELYDINNNQITAAVDLGEVGLEWSVIGFADFSGNPGEDDMLMRNSNSGALEYYDIMGNTIAAIGSMGQIGLEWTVVGFGDFSGKSNETDMLMRNTNSGDFELYDINDNLITAAVDLGDVGLEWSVIGFGDFSSNPGEDDMLMQDTSNGDFELFDITNNTIVSATALGQVGAEWQLSGIAAATPSAAVAPTLDVQSASGAAGTAIGLSIVTAPTATDGTASLSINIAGLPNGGYLSAGTQNGDGSWTLTPSQLSNLALMVPSGDFAGTANLAVTSTVLETNGSTASASAVLTVAVAGVATAPTLSVPNASGDAGTAIGLSISTAATAPDETESLSINIAGLPGGAFLSTGTQNGDGSWTLTPAQLNGLKVATVTAQGGASTVDLSVISTAIETDGSTASTRATLPVSIAATPAPPSGTTADMIMRNTKSGANEIYDLGGNSILAGYTIALIGTQWQVAGLGGFDGSASDMLLRNSSTGAFEVYDISNNVVTNAAPMGQVGLEWEVAGFGDFSGNPGETDMLMQNSNSGDFEVYDIRNNAIYNDAPMGQVGLEWRVAGFGDFSSNPAETDMLMQNTNDGDLEVFDINTNTITYAVSIGQIGTEWTFAGFGDFSGNANETDMLMRNSNTGAFEVYDIADNTITYAASIGQVGLEWQVLGFGSINGAGTSDMLMRNTNSGALEIYDITNNQITSGAPMGQVGMEWTAAGIAADVARFAACERATHAGNRIVCAVRCRHQHGSAGRRNDRTVGHANSSRCVAKPYYQ